MRYYLVVGEASGDLHASNLMHSLKKQDENAEFRFFGGDLMQNEGGELVKHYKDSAFMGFLPVILNAKTILNNISLCKKDIANYYPDAVILVDYPGFNLKIAKYVHTKLKIPVFYYISPHVWAWKRYRVNQIRRYVDKMLSILPFESDFYDSYNCPVSYVGNPTLDAIEARSHKDETFSEFIEENGFIDKPIIALLPGSREREIKLNLPIMLQAVADLQEGYHIVVAAAPGRDNQDYTGYLPKDSEVTILFGQTYRLLAQSEVAVVTSGTATLECALLNVPQVVCYKTPVPRLSYLGFKNILHTPYISLVNLICGREVVRELFASKLSVDSLRQELNKILTVKNYRQNILYGYQEMRDILGEPGASDRAAQIIFETLKSR